MKSVRACVQVLSLCLLLAAARARGTEGIEDVASEAAFDALLATSDAKPLFAVFYQEGCYNCTVTLDALEPVAADWSSDVTIATVDLRDEATDSILWRYISGRVTTPVLMVFTDGTMQTSAQGLHTAAEMETFLLPYVADGTLGAGGGTQTGGGGTDEALGVTLAVTDGSGAARTGFLIGETVRVAVTVRGSAPVQSALLVAARSPVGGDALYFAPSWSTVMEALRFSPAAGTYTVLSMGTEMLPAGTYTIYAGVVDYAVTPLAAVAEASFTIQ